MSIDSASSDKSLLEHLKSCVTKSLQPGTAVVIAVSGGLDSMALLYLVHDVAPELNLTVTAAHFHHQLRSRSDAEAELVMDFCRSRSIPCRKGQPEDTFAEGNLEQWARRVRYRFLEEVRKEQQADVILTAHTQDDVIETLFIKLLSNKELSSVELYDPRRKVARPLLNVTRAQLERYVAFTQIPYAVDESNFSLMRLRNKVRHLLLPLLYQEFGDYLHTTLAESAQSIAEDLACLQQWSRDELRHTHSYPWGSKQWLREVVSVTSRLPDPIKWRFVEAILLPHVGFKVGRRTAMRVSFFFEGSSPRIQLPGGQSLIRKQGGIIVEPT